MLMRVVRTKDGLALLLPKELEGNPFYGENAEVDVTCSDGMIIIQPAGLAPASLDELLSRVTDENKHDEISWGPPVGKEAW